MQRLGFTQSATIEHRKLAIDMAEVVQEWEKRRYKEEQAAQAAVTGDSGSATAAAGVKRQASQEVGSGKVQRGSMGQKVPANDSESPNPQGKYFERSVYEAVCNFLFRVACQVFVFCSCLFWEGDDHGFSRP